MYNYYYALDKPYMYSKSSLGLKTNRHMLLPILQFHTSLWTGRGRQQPVGRGGTVAWSSPAGIAPSRTWTLCASLELPEMFQKGSNHIVNGQ